MSIGKAKYLGTLEVPMNENRLRPLFPSDDIGFPDSYRSFRFPSSPTRPEPAKNGMTFYNSMTKMLESYQDGEWIALFKSTSADPEPSLRIEAGFNVKLEERPDGAIRINVPEVGDLTTAMNVGSGQGSIFQKKTGTNLNFRRLVSANEHLQIETGDETISFTVRDPGETNTIRNIGAGVPLYTAKAGPELLLRTLTGSMSINVSHISDMIQFDLGSDLVFNGKIGIGLPQTAGSQSEPGRLRYNPEKDALEAGLKDGWHTVGTVTGMFLPLSGGSLGGVLEAPRLSTSDLLLKDGILHGAGMQISLEGASIVSGFTGLIDGIRFPDVSVWWKSYTGAAEGFLVKTKEGLSTAQITAVPGQLLLNGTTIGFADNPTLPGMASVLLPSGPQETRDERIGAIRYNSKSAQFEGRQPSGWNNFTTSDRGTFEEVVIRGNVFIGGTMNGRNFGMDLEAFAQMDNILGIPRRSTEGGTAVTIQADPDKPGIHVSDTGSTLLIGVNPKELVQPILDQIDTELVRSGSTVIGRTIDGRDLARDGVVIDHLEQIGIGVMTSEGNGQFQARTITPSALPTGVGLSVDNPHGEGEIRIGLRLGELPQVTDMKPTDRIVVFTDRGNATISFGDLLSAIKVGLN